MCRPGVVTTQPALLHGRVDWGVRWDDVHVRVLHEPMAGEGSLVDHRRDDHAGAVAVRAGTSEDAPPHQ